MSEESNPTSPEESEGAWWHTVLWGVFLFIFSGFLYWYFTDFENSQETSRRMHALLAILYNIGGKTLVCSVFAGAGGICCILGFKNLLTGEEKT